MSGRRPSSQPDDPEDEEVWDTPILGVGSYMAYYYLERRRKVKKNPIGFSAGSRPKSGGAAKRPRS